MEFTGSASTNVGIGDNLFTDFARIAQYVGRGLIKCSPSCGVATTEEPGQGSLHPLIKHPKTDMSPSQAGTSQMLINTDH